MAYNNFPMGYQYYYPQQVQQQPQSSNSGSIIWVQGEAGAKSYLVAPNNTVQLWDSERQTIYLKSADASGMPSMKVLDYTIRQEGSQTPNFALQTDKPSEISRKDLEELQRQIDALKEQVRAFSAKIKEEDHE